MKKQEFKLLEELGRVQLSEHFFMREFLYSEISQIEKIPNIPDDPELAIAAGKHLCEKVLEPIQAALGRISIRSGFRSCMINAKGAENKNQYNCAENEKNYARHIWDRKDKDDYMGATACIVVTSFISYYKRTKDWTALAWWIHDHIKDYAEMEFFAGDYAAFNITWSDNPDTLQNIYSYVENPHTGKHSGYMTKPGMENFEGSHEPYYREFLNELHA
jgi:hypothetical protein